MNSSQNADGVYLPAMGIDGWDMLEENQYDFSDVHTPATDASYTVATSTEPDGGISSSSSSTTTTTPPPPPPPPPSSCGAADGDYSSFEALFEDLVNMPEEHQQQQEQQQQPAVEMEDTMMSDDLASGEYGQYRSEVPQVLNLENQPEVFLPVAEGAESQAPYDPNMDPRWVPTVALPEFGAYPLASNIHAPELGMNVQQPGTYIQGAAIYAPVPAAELDLQVRPATYAPVSEAEAHPPVKPPIQTPVPEIADTVVEEAAPAEVEVEAVPARRRRRGGRRAAIRNRALTPSNQDRAAPVKRTRGKRVYPMDRGDWAMYVTLAKLSAAVTKGEPQLDEENDVGELSFNYDDFGGEGPAEPTTALHQTNSQATGQERPYYHEANLFPDLRHLAGLEPEMVERLPANMGMPEAPECTCLYYKDHEFRHPQTGKLIRHGPHPRYMKGRLC